MKKLMLVVLFACPVVYAAETNKTVEQIEQEMNTIVNEQKISSFINVNCPFDRPLTLPYLLDAFVTTNDVASKLPKVQIRGLKVKNKPNQVKISVKLGKGSRFKVYGHAIIPKNKFTILEIKDKKTGNTLKILVNANGSTPRTFTLYSYGIITKGERKYPVRMVERNKQIKPFDARRRIGSLNNIKVPPNAELPKEISIEASKTANP